MRRWQWDELSETSRAKILSRPKYPDSSRESVQSIVEAVRRFGDDPLRSFTLEFDGCALDSFAIDAELLKICERALEPELKAAIQEAILNITIFHKKQLRSRYEVEPQPGIRLSREFHPIGRVGFYIPGGTAPLLSTLMMLTIPARLGGCENIIVCTPPDQDGKVDSKLLGLASLLGIQRIFKVGGAQAIAAMAYGTETIPKVDKIFGPGNRWVDAAKMLVATTPGGASIDMPAGPSELMIVADRDSSAEFIAADLLSQAEHGADSQVIFLSLDRKLSENVSLEIEAQLRKLRRASLISESLQNALIIDVSSRAEALAVIERYAPEHLSLQVEDAESWVPSIRNAASVFCGPWTPEAAGDYASGTNHVLPTGGWAKSFGGLTVESFQTSMTVQTLTKDALQRLSATLQTLARAEGLDAHAEAVGLRVRAMRDKL